jgi:hypothetical protein
LKVLKSTNYPIKPRQAHYDCFETGAFCTYVGKKKKMMAYLRVSPGNWGNTGIEPDVRCMGEPGFRNGAKAEE